MNATNAVNVTLEDKAGDNVVNAAKLNFKTATGTADVASIDLTATAATTNVGLTELEVQAIETLNVNFGTGTAGTQSAFDFEANDADDLKALNITGSADVHLTLDAHVMNVVAATIDASALTGKFELSDNSSALFAGSKVIATSQNDTIDATDAGVTYQAGAGVDAITTALASILADGSSSDITIDGGTGIDTLTLSETGDVTITDSHFTKLSNLEKLTLSSTGNNSISAGTNFTNTFGDSITITTATLADTKTFAYNGGLYNGDVTLVVTSAGVGDNASQNLDITTAGGTDKVTLTAASFVGGDGASEITVSTGAGNDTITVDLGTIANDVTDQTLTITAGTGADTISLDKVNGHTSAGAHYGSAKFVIAAGDSLTTAYDSITGFDDGGTADLSDILDFAGTSAVSDFTQSNDFGTIKSHSLSNGVVSFDDTDVYDTALVINSSNLSDALGYLAANTANLDTVAFNYDSTGDGTADASFVYNNNSVDSLVYLVGHGDLTHVISGATVGANKISIA